MSNNISKFSLTCEGILGAVKRRPRELEYNSLGPIVITKHQICNRAENINLTLWEGRLYLVCGNTHLNRREYIPLLIHLRENSHTHKQTLRIILVVSIVSQYKLNTPKEREGISLRERET